MSLDVGDINRDGNPDIIAGYGAEGIHIWTGDGAGNWNAFTSPINNLTFNDVKIGNINNDGHPDIVGATEIGIYVWTGNSAGSWTNISPAFESRPFYSLALDDIDQDGKIDIVAGSRGQGVSKAIWVYLNRGAGTWVRGDANMPFSGTYYGVTTGDFNRDGKPDIVGSANGLNAWSGNGAGTWTLRSTGLPSTGIYSDVELCDFNLDGKLDLIATTQNNGGLRVWNGNGAGTWVPTSNLPSTGNYRGVKAADINIDGYMDIITASSNSDLTIWSGDGQDNWYMQNIGMTSGLFHKSISIGDLNKDGRIDLCYLNSTGEIDIWICEVEREVNAWTQFNSPNTTGILRDVLISDINQDGKKDICYAFNSKGIEIWKGDGNGNWSIFNSPATTGNFNSVISLDYNKDGKMDIISTSDAGVKAWQGDGTGNWTSNNPSTSNAWLGLAAADLNKDGNMDFVAGTGNNQGIRQYNGNGAGTWTPRAGLPFTGTYYSIDVGDVNRDGALDIITAHGGLKVFLGNGNDVWTDSSSGLPGITENYRNVKAADINNDGIMDIIGVSTTAGANAWLGDGTGQWTAYSNIVPAHAAGLAVADFSIDGKLDICTGSAIGTGAVGKRNAGTTWSNVSAGLAFRGNFTAFELADINIDGRMDIITFNNSDGTPRIWTGDYQLPPPQSFFIGPLAVGWNLVSFPLVQANTTLPGALTDLDGDTSWTTVKCYDNVQKRWLTYRLGGTANALSNVGNSMGIWLFISDAGSLGDGYIRIQGQEPATTSMDLKTGWNLVGFPSPGAALATDILPAQVDMLSVFQPSTPYIQDHTLLSGITLNPGNGYWVHVTADCVLNIHY
jgi:hypothetical protein